MRDSLTRISAVLLRQLYLHKRSLPRNLEIFFWPVMDLMVWGFLTVYIRQITQTDLSHTIVFLIGAMIFWDILYRAQQGISIPLMEELWTRNLTNLLVTPLRAWEWVGAMFLYGFLKIVVTVLFLCFIAFLLYHFNLGMFGLALVPFVFNLLVFGWSVGIVTAGLLIWWGYSAEALIWGIPFFLQPVSAVFYPLDVLPQWLRAVGAMLPSTYIFEGMRAVIKTGQVSARILALSTALNAVYFTAAVCFFLAMMRLSQKHGRLAKLGQD